jgi:hypothetical protein
MGPAIDPRFFDSGLHALLVDASDNACLAIARVTQNRMLRAGAVSTRAGFGDV